jgi:hypothetical protein
MWRLMGCGEYVSTVVAALAARLVLVVLTRRCRDSYFANTARAFVSAVNMVQVELGQVLVSWQGA